ncbi:hypothetical protein EYF80_011537 [Liparis tanakae]|uniref:Uncharacterized protein n=1 Tax=Liparis tanakae TaxID=230148 RepID=A0A4Z2IKN4_9TELE|nr:hypothetical protein EYF80_011537 [Liparis tanakae]
MLVDPAEQPVLRGERLQIVPILAIAELTATNSVKLIFSSLLVSPAMKVSAISRTLYPGREKLASRKSSWSSKSLTKPL